MIGNGIREEERICFCRVLEVIVRIKDFILSEWENSIGL